MELVDNLNAAIVRVMPHRVVVAPFVVSEGGGSLGVRLSEAIGPYVMQGHAMPESEVPLFDGSPDRVRALSRATDADVIIVGRVDRFGILNYSLVEGPSGLVLHDAIAYVPSTVLRESASGRKQVTTEAAVEVARNGTRALLRGDSDDFSKMFDKPYTRYEMSSFRHRLPRGNLALVRVFKTAPRRMSSSRAYVTCDMRTFVIGATIRDDDQRLIEWSSRELRVLGSSRAKRLRLSDDADVTARKFSAFIADLHAAFPIDTRYVPKVRDLPMERRFCANRPIQWFGRVAGPPIEVTSVFLTVDDLDSSVEVRVDVNEAGRIVTWGVQRATSEDKYRSSRAKPAPRHPKLLPETVTPKEVVRSTLQRSVATARVDGRRALESLQRYGVGGEEYLLADEAMPAVEQVRSLTMNALAVPELEPLRRWMASSLDTARPATVERVLVVNGQEVVYRLVPVAAIKRFKAAWEDSLTKAETLKDIAPDITVASEPDEAKFKLFMKDDTSAAHHGATDDILRNVYRGLYDLVVEKKGHKTCKPSVDLVNDPRTTIKCRLVPEASAGDECICRRE